MRIECHLILSHSSILSCRYLPPEDWHSNSDGSLEPALQSIQIVRPTGNDIQVLESFVDGPGRVDPSRSSFSLQLKCSELAGVLMAVNISSKTFTTNPMSLSVSTPVLHAAINSLFSLCTMELSLATISKSNQSIADAKNVYATVAAFKSGLVLSCFRKFSLKIMTYYDFTFPCRR